MRTNSQRRLILKKTLFAVVAATVVMFSLAGLYTGVLVHEFIVNNVDPTLLRNPPNMALIAFGYFVLALLMAILYPRLVLVTGSPAMSGLRFGLVAGVCWLMPYSLVLFGVYKFPYVALPLDFAWALVEQGIGGLVIGLIYGKSSNKI
jgi:hypothetical protein